MEEFKDTPKLYMQTLHGGVATTMGNRQKHWVTKLRSLVKSEAQLQSLQISCESSKGSAHNYITPTPNKVNWATYRYWSRFHRANSIQIWKGSDKQCLRRTVYLWKHESRSPRSPVQMFSNNAKTFQPTKKCCRHWEKMRISLIT